MRETVRELGERRATGFLKKFYGWYLGRGRFPRPFKQELVLLENDCGGRGAAVRIDAGRAIRARAHRAGAAGVACLLDDMPSRSTERTCPSRSTAAG